MKGYLQKIQVLVVAVILCIVCSGCLYSQVKRPLDTDLNNTSLGDKVGKASNHSILWLVAWGDAGTEAAAKEGGITTITHMDEEYYILLFGLYTQTTTIVYGN